MQRDCIAGGCSSRSPPSRSSPRRSRGNASAPRAPLVWVVMGVSGCGKSTVGSQLARRLQCPFYDADNYHPAANIRKMQAGVPLTDDDRWPWLQQLRQLLAAHIASSTRAVLACSALKPAYRQLLRSAADDVDSVSDPARAPPPIAFVLLNPPRAVLQARCEARAASGAHFMPASLLDSQLRQLEVPDPSELYMCFGQCCCAAPDEPDGGASSEFPSTEVIVDAIVARAGREGGVESSSG